LKNNSSSLAGDAGIPLSKVNDVDYLIYHHGDHLGSTHLITEGKKLGRHAGISYPRGTVIQRFEYLPWGQEAFALNPNQSYDPRFTGQEYDIETGLYFYKARYYNPALGRFIQPDTIVSDPTDPQSYNRYAYVRNNPLKYVDPSGHKEWHFTDDDTGEPTIERYNREFDKIGHEAYENAVEVGVIDPSTSGGLAGNTTNANRNDYLGAYDNNHSGDRFGFDYGGSSDRNTFGATDNRFTLNVDVRFRVSGDIVSEANQLGVSLSVNMASDVNKNKGLHSQFIQFVSNNFNEKTLLRNALIGVGVGVIIGAITGGPLGTIGGGIYGFGAGFIGTYHVMEIVEDPATAFWPFYDERTTPTPDRNNNNIADIFE